MNMEDFAQEARRLSEADYSTYTEERALIRELLRSAAELGEAIVKQRKKADAVKSVPYHEVIDMYNDICSLRLPKVIKVSDARRRRIKSRFADGYTIEDFRTLFKTAVETPFLCGENSRNWTANFDWLIEPGNMLKVLEGNYSTSSARTSGGADHSYDLDMFDSFALKNTPKL